MNFKKTFSLLLMLSLSVLILSGCAGGGTKLSMSVEPNTGKIKLMQKLIKTDGDSISVSADNIPSGAEMQVYLYNELRPGEYIAVKSLNSTKSSAELPVETPGLSYKIGAVLFGTDKAVSLEIRYSES